MKEMQELIEAAQQMVNDPECNCLDGSPEPCPYERLKLAIAAARASEGGWRAIKEGCEMPEILPDQRCDHWEWSLPFTVVYMDYCKRRQSVGSLSRDVRDGTIKIITEEGDAVEGTHWKPLDWPSPPLSVETPK